MFLLRFLLIFAMAYYLLRFLGGLLFGKKKEDRKNPGFGDQKRNSPDYNEITDQKVEDADYEEL
ncbi:MAG: hypothetical protein KOO63_12880 [Bacteroidales bacterium]|nr:hypothetical protein [Candidatus Latescibacterota bacterium]